MRITCLFSVILMVTAFLPFQLGAEPAAPATDTTDGQAAKPEAPQPTHKEIGAIGRDAGVKFKKLASFTMDSKGNLLCCDEAGSAIKVVSQKGKLLATWKLKFRPRGIAVAKDGTIYVGGRGQVAKLNSKGKVLKTVKAGEKFPEASVSGMAVNEKDLFVAFGTKGSTRSRSVIVRFDRNLDKATEIAKGLRGCCRRLDMLLKDGVLYVAENGAHRVVKFDREGKVLSKWGRRDRKDISGFGSCCNPMNLYFGPGGELYTAESGLGRIKRYTADGKYLGLVGYVDTNRFTRASRLAASCSNISLRMNEDASRIFVLDYKNSLIRVLLRSNKANAKP